MFNNSIFKDETFSPVLQEAATKALPEFITAEGEKLYEAGSVIARAFKGSQKFLELLKNKNPESEIKIIESFQKNAGLLVQKTWVEKEDEEFKDEVVYRIEKLCEALLKINTGFESGYKEILPECFAILNDVIVLLFGDIVQQPDFLDYAIRIDPDFGFFYYYVTAISKLETFSEEKARLSILNAIYFLSNF